MELPIDKIAANVARVVRADTSPAMDVEIEAMIDLCEHAMPHDDWASIRRIDFSAGLPKLKSWCQRTLSDDPPIEPIRGMYFSLCHPCDERRDHVYLDLEMVGTSSPRSSVPPSRFSVQIEYMSAGFRLRLRDILVRVVLLSLLRPLLSLTAHAGRDVHIPASA